MRVFRGAPWVFPLPDRRRVNLPPVVTIAGRIWIEAGFGLTLGLSEHGCLRYRGEEASYRRRFGQPNCDEVGRRNLGLRLCGWRLPK